MEVDTTPPVATTSVIWAESSPFNNFSVTATWAISVSGDVISQRIDYYNDGVCSIHNSSITFFPTATSDSFIGTSGTTYSYIVYAIDSAGNETASACSNSMMIDNDAPVSASSMSWVEGASSSASVFNLTWTPSVSGDVIDQVINIYESTSCGGISVETSSPLTSSDTTYSFASPISSKDYTYTITTTDIAGNATTSPCSASISKL